MAQRQFMVGHKLVTSTFSSCTCSLNVNNGKNEFLYCRGVAGPRRIFIGSVASEDSSGHALTIKELLTNIRGHWDIVSHTTNI
jgi:hypothetical protein